METIRSFIAIELPEQIRNDIGSLQSRLKTGGQNWLKWVSPDSVHLTLKFLGDIDSEKIPEITQAIGESVSGISPFRLRVKGLGVFPNMKRIQVVWVGLTGDLDKLQKIQENIEFNLAVLDYPEEGRQFTPHLTLARVKYAAPAPEQDKFAVLLNSTAFESAAEVAVNSISLMKSQLTPRGAIYNRVGSVPLG